MATDTLTSLSKSESSNSMAPNLKSPEGTLQQQQPLQENLLRPPLVPTSQEQEQQHAPLESSLSASSDIVQALFGDTVGPSWGDFFCTHARLRGRLYATTSAVLYYSNILGFEKRLSLEYRDVLEMALFRTTSIRISMLDGETYIFKSFQEREQVLHLLRGLKMLVDKKAGRLTRMEQQETAHRLALGASPPRIVRSVAAFPPPMYTNRRRAISDSNVRFASSPADVRVAEEQSETCDPSELDDSEGFDESQKEAWERAQDPREILLADVGIKFISLDCTLDTFFELFLADRAPHSLDRYQRDHIKDKDVVMTEWKLGGEGGTMSRTLTFAHPFKNAMVGPSEVRTTRHQTFRRYGDLGMILKNHTTIEGIPNADAFHVQDVWVIRLQQDGKLALSTRFESRFTKRAIFKSIIEKNVRKETKEWYSGYAKMIDMALPRNDGTPVAVSSIQRASDGSEAAKSTATPSYIQLIPVLLILILLTLLVQIMLFQASVNYLASEIRILREDNAHLRNALDRAGCEL